MRQIAGAFYDTTQPDNRAAFATLHEVLVVVCRLLAPFCPFVTDFIHRELTGDVRASARSYRAGSNVAAAADEPLELRDERNSRAWRGSAARRGAAGINVRKPLSEVVCVAFAGDGPALAVAAPNLAALTPLLAGELNVKRSHSPRRPTHSSP